MSYPNIILITDSIPCADGGGISQTLYNLLSNYPGETWTITRPEEKKPDSLILKTTIIPIRLEQWKPWNNRLGKWVNVWIAKVNHWILDKKLFPMEEFSDQKNTLIMVSTTEPLKLHFAYCIQRQLNCQILPYFMDDWVYDKQISWITGNIQQVVKDIHQKANAWLMISENLHRAFLTRYSLKNKPYMVIHNPVSVVSSQISSKNTFDEGLIIYAGSIWPMHLDAIVITAKAVAKLQAEGLKHYRLLIYTSPSTWEANKHILQMPGVSYGGFVSYNQLTDHLQKGWLLLVPSSFEPQNKGFTASSVQTKLTDYMSTARPVLYVGPSEGASGVFVKEWDCGFCFENQNHAELSKLLETIAVDKSSWLDKAEKGKLAIAEHFNKEIVQKKLYDFLNNHY